MGAVAVAVGGALARDVEEVGGAAGELGVLDVDPRVHDIGARVRARALIIVRVARLPAVPGPVRKPV